MTNTDDVWLLDVVVDGRPYHYSTRNVEVDGVEYHACLEDVSVAKGAESVELAILDPHVTWADLALIFDGSLATLSRTTAGDPEIYVTGQVRVRAWGGPADPISFGIESRVLGADIGAGVPLPSHTTKITVNAWPVDVGTTYPSEYDGEYPPIILGFPGYLRTETGGVPDVYPVVPVPLVQHGTTFDNTYALVSEDPGQNISAVRLRIDTGLDEGTASQYNEAVAEVLLDNYPDGPLTVRDKLDRPARVVAMSEVQHRYAVRDAKAIWAGYYPFSAAGGVRGLHGGGGGGPPDLYSAITYLLRRFGSRTDWGRMSEVESILERYACDTWINEPVSDPWAWIEGTILSALISVDIYNGDHGFYLAPRRFRSDPRWNTGTVRVGVDATPVGSAGISEGPYNEFVANFRVNRDGNGHKSVVTLCENGGASTGGGGGVGAATTGELGARIARHTYVGGYVRQAMQGLLSNRALVFNDRCAASVAHYGSVPYGTPFDIGWTWDEGSVIAILRDYADCYALPARMVSYMVDDGEDLEVGGEVTLYDEDRGFDGVAAIVDAPPTANANGTATVDFRVPQ